MNEIRYDESSIQHLKGLEHIRTRPNGYIRTRDNAGIIHTIRENIDNSIDELIQVPQGSTEPRGGTIYVCMFKDKVHNKFQILIKDDGRGIPSKKLKEVTTEIFASGKLNTNAYVVSGGQFGIGAKVATALSTRYRALSSNYLEDVVGEVSVANGNVLSNNTEHMQYPSGVITVFELDTERFFTDSEDFIDVGQIDLVKLCRSLNMFNDCVNFQIYIYERRISEDFWKASIPDALGIVDDFIQHKKKEIVYDSTIINDKASFLFDEYWRVNSNPNFSETFFRRNLDLNMRLKEFTIKMYLTRKSTTGYVQCFAAVNNVVLKYKVDNSVSKVVLEELGDRISKYMETEQLMDFVRDDYKFTTMLLAMDVRYSGAELAGVTKDGFDDTAFEAVFSKQVKEVFDAKGDEFWRDLAQKILPDIENRYAQLYDAPLKKSEARKTFLELNFVTNFKECENYDDRSELYIVEGNSASGITNSRDVSFQAIYTTRGKPINCATQYGSMASDRQTLMKDPIYQDLMRIIGVGPNTTDLSTAKIKKIIIATDADPDGYHIAALHLNNFSILNPRIVESGMVWIAKPPLYSLVLNNKYHIFLRDKAALYDKRINLLYNRNLDIRLIGPDGQPKALDVATHRETCYLIHYLGEVFTRAANQLNIPLLILERLVYAIKYIYPKIDYLNLAKCFESADQPGYVRVNYTDEFLIISIDRKDYVVGLQDLGRMVAEHLLQLINRYRYNDLMFSVRPRTLDNKWGKPIAMSGMMLYTVMTQLDEKLNIERYKGLGQMEEDACYATIMNPATRAVVQIKSLGDLETSYSIVGKADSGPRKQLLFDSNVLSNTFVREQSLTRFED